MTLSADVRPDFDACLPGATRLHATRERRGPSLQVFQPRGWEWNAYTLPVHALPVSLDGFKILHLSDFHCRPTWLPQYDELIERVHRASADVILYTGDFVEDKIYPRHAFEVAGRLVKALKARLGFFSILGNHDLDVMRDVVRREWNVMPIDHRRLILTGTDGDSIELIGLAGLDRHDNQPDFIRSIPPRPPRAIRIVMNHYPDGLRRAWSLAPELYLCGHTHGGQICLPGGYPPNRHDSLPAPFIHGVNKIHDTWMSTTAGFGFSSALQVRTFCPAEAVELTLVRE